MERIIQIYFSVQLIPYAILALIALLFVGIFLKNRLWHLRYHFSKRNCFECEHYHLDDVSSVGQGCWYKCDVFQRRTRHDMNTRQYYMKKCESYKER